MIRPLSLSLESAGYRIVSERFFAKSRVGKIRIADHQVARYHRHLDDRLPIAILLRTALLQLRRVVVLSFLAVGLYPFHCFREFPLVEDL